MSTIAVEEWAKAGYTNLYNLEGGFAAWKDAGYELLLKDQ
jgi:rhodanese-related sulfurtransferase